MTVSAPAPALPARRLLRTALTASLGTVDAEGAPHVSYVAFATAMDGAPILLFSTLAAHTRNLARAPRVALLVGDAPRREGDPMDSARLTLHGTAAPSSDPLYRARYLRRHPAAELYAGFDDFSIYALAVAAVHFVGGFAFARSLSAGEVLLDGAALRDLAAAEADIVQHMNQDHAAAISLYATRLLGCSPGEWRMTGIDPEGCDLRANNETARLEFERPIATASDARSAFVAAAQKARLGS